MAIFGRRTIQWLIDGTATVITRRQINKIVDELNAMPTTETLSPDWELILLNVFSKIGRVKHGQSSEGIPGQTCFLSVDPIRTSALLAI